MLDVSKTKLLFNHYIDKEILCICGHYTYSGTLLRVDDYYLVLKGCFTRNNLTEESISNTDEILINAKRIESVSVKL